MPTEPPPPDIIPEEFPATPEGFPIIDIENPLLEVFALQHDLRERYLVAITEVIELIDSESCGMAEIVEVLRAAIDEDKIREWIDNGRPLPSLDVPMAEQIEKFDDSMETLASFLDSEQGGKVE